jgi:hypothetical protein
MESEFGNYGAGASEDLRRERDGAERRARAAAWQLEKEEAVENIKRTARVRRRGEEARLRRQAAELRRFWQTHGGATRQDVAAVIVFLIGSAGIAFAWRARLQPAREEEPGIVVAAAATRVTTAERS